MPGLAPPAGPAFAPAPPAPVRPRTRPDRTVPPLDAFVEVAAAVYRLGEPGEEREVALGPVLIGRWPVVNAHVRAFVEETGRAVSPPLRARLDAPQLADHPATEVTFAEALAFCAWAGARLPTGAEWEAAARGADGRPWPWGVTFDPDRCACAEAATGWTEPVRAHPEGAAPCGAEQLAGNVWEWVADPADEDGWRVVRGGSYLDHALGRPRLARARRRPRRARPRRPASASRRIHHDQEDDRERGPRARPRRHHRRAARRLRPVLRRPRREHRRHGRRRGRPRRRRPRRRRPRPDDGLVPVRRRRCRPPSPSACSAWTASRPSRSASCGTPCWTMDRLSESARAKLDNAARGARALPTASDRPGERSLTMATTETRPGDASARERKVEGVRLRLRLPHLQLRPEERARDARA